MFTPPKCKFAPWWRSDALAATAAWLRNTKMRIALPLPTRLSRLRCLSSRAIHLSPTLFTAAAVPADIAALNQKVEAAAHGTPLLSAAPPQVARKARAALFKHEPRRVDLRVPGLREGSPSVGISIFMPRDGGEHGQSRHPGSGRAGQLQFELPSRACIRQPSLHTQSSATDHATQAPPGRATCTSTEAASSLALREGQNDSRLQRMANERPLEAQPQP